MVAIRIQKLNRVWFRRGSVVKYFFTGGGEPVEEGNDFLDVFCIPSSALSSIFAWVSLYIKVA